uniref:DUF3326 domain-containing protein n=1 Tax=Paulinella micropora TaxID=1928728 RepID=A0A385HZS7_9EUKA|nr:hypothetical protein PMNZ_202 [Paulinella micropora]AXY63156.1 hypothetical protein PMNZ_202 [Paulinella micropora]
MSFSPLPVLMIVPTGIGCSIGGYAGDALPSARLLAAASGCLITHPNVMNGASLYWRDPRIYYVEGWALNQFVSSKIFLMPVRQQQIGLLIDSGIEPDLILRHLQVADACRATLGLNIGPIVRTDQPLKVKLTLGGTGISWGHIGSPDSLIRAGEKLRDLGSTAIAIIARFPDDCVDSSLSSYRQGNGVDSLAGAEAIISHLLGSHLKIPCAHAPALNPVSITLMIDPRVAGEEIGYTFLPSVLVGLSQAPSICNTSLYNQCREYNGWYREGPITSNDIGAIVVPSSALGSEAVLTCSEKNIPIITVEENTSVLKVEADQLNIHNTPVRSYAEAAGLILALREGIAFGSLFRPINGLTLHSENYL